MMHIGINSFVNLIAEKKRLIVKVYFNIHAYKGTRYKVQAGGEL